MASSRGSGCWSSTTCWPPAGTAAAACELVERVGGVVVGLAVLLELTFLSGRGAAARS